MSRMPPRKAKSRPSGTRSIVDLYDRAVKLLGASRRGPKGAPVPNIEARVAAIATLREIARASREHELLIRQILAAYLRESAPAIGPSKGRAFAALSIERRRHMEKIWGRLSAEDRSRSLRRAVRQRGDPPASRGDIQFAMNVLAGFKPNPEFRDEGRLDLRDLNLRGLRLEGSGLAPLEGLRWADFTGSDFWGADLSNVDLEQTKLDWCCLRGARLAQLVLREASLEHAILSEATLFDNDMRRSSLFVADLSGANLVRNELERVCLIDAKLDRASLLKADLSKAKLFQATFQGARLQGANLQDADFGADWLRGDPAYAARVRETYRPFLDASLCGADLSAARGLQAEYFEGAITDEATKLPKDLKRIQERGT